MSKIATVKLGWVRSVSPDVVKTILNVAIDGQPTSSAELSPDVQQAVIEVSAKTSVVFSVTSVDSEGLSTASEIYSFTVGDLEAPQPATNLFHQVVSVHDAVDPVSEV